MVPFKRSQPCSSLFLLYCKIKRTLMVSIRIALALCKSKNRHAELETMKMRVCVYLGIWAASRRSLKTHVCGVLAGPNLAVILCFRPVGDRLQRRYRGPAQSLRRRADPPLGSPTGERVNKGQPPQNKHIIECFSIHRSLKSACNKNRSGRNYCCSIGAWNQPALRNHFLLNISSWGLCDLCFF